MYIGSMFIRQTFYKVVRDFSDYCIACAIKLINCMRLLLYTDSAFRLNVSEANLPRIPAHPIGYDDARVLLGYVSLHASLLIF